jgi:hypothetical protein
MKYSVIQPVEQPVQQISFAPLSDADMLQLLGGKSAPTPVFTLHFGSFCSSKLQQ